jgi:hypothetical protein
MFTPSQTHRVQKCPVSETYPHIQRETGYSAAGTAAHHFFARVRELRGQAAAKDQAREIALREVEVEDPEQFAVLEALPLDDPRLPSLDPAAYTAELAMALHLGSGEARVLGKGLTREEAHALARPGEMVGIADLAGEASGAGVVWDLKFGHGKVPRAAVNLQVRTYLLMLTRALNLDEGFAGLVRVWGEDDVWPDVVSMDDLELYDQLDLLRRLARTVDELRARPPAERPAPVEGPWCTHCPAYLSCPAKRALLYALVHDPEGTLPAPTEGTLAPAAMGEGWRKVRRAKQVLERVEAIYKELARITPIPLGDGEVLGERVTESEGLVGPVAARVLADKLPVVGRVIAEEARSEMTKAALERAVKKHLMPTLPRLSGKPQPFAPVQRDLMRLLAEHGATRVTQVRKVMEFTPKPALPGGSK